MPTGLACATQVVSGWSLARQANETVVVSIDAMHLGAVAPAARGGFGGILLFGSRASSVMATTITALQRMTPSHTTMMVMTDEEGGGVTRLNNVVAPFPWAQQMGQSMTPSQIAATALRVGAQLAAVGVNTDLAPVLDLDARAVWPGPTNPDGLRSFGGAPLKSSVDGVAFVRGLAKSGVLSVVKHFPGLGGSTGNTDYGTAATRPWSVLAKTGLVPFQQAVNDGVRAVMMSNATVPGLSTLPASLSPVVVSVLRSQLGFQGLIMTDSLTAGAIGALHLSAPQAAVLALRAGVDQVITGSSSSPASALTMATSISNALQAAVMTGQLSRATLIAAAAQVLNARNTPVCTPPTT